MIAVDLAKGQKVADLFDVIVLVNIHHANTMKKGIKHKIVPLLELKSFEGAPADEPFIIAGHGLKGILCASGSTAATFKDGQDIEKGVASYVKLAIEDSLKKDLPIPNEFIVQSCYGAIGSSVVPSSGKKGTYPEMPSVVTALAILLAKYGINNTTVKGYKGPAISARVLGKTFAISADPSTTNQLKATHNFAQIEQTVKGISDIYKRSEAAASLTENFYNDFLQALKSEKLILDKSEGEMIQTATDGAKLLPPGYKTKTKASIIAKKGA